MNIRLWKNTAWKPIGTIGQREERSLQYREKLINKYIHSNKIRRIANHRHLPKYILNSNKRKQDQIVSRHNKKINKEANTGIREEHVKDKERVIEDIQVREEEESNYKKKKNTKVHEEEK